MSGLMVFKNPEFGLVRTVSIDGEPWLVGKDVASILEYKEPTKAVRDHVDREDRGVSKIDTPSGGQEMVIINESGLYALILSSKLPGARKFKRWVTGEVLPSIRATGSYGTAVHDAVEAAKLLDRMGDRASAREVLRQAGFPIVDEGTASVPGDVLELDDVVEAFLADLLPQVRTWTLIPFPVLQAAFSAWVKASPEYRGLAYSRNGFLRSVEGLMPRHGWHMPVRDGAGKCRPYRTRGRMEGHEPVLVAYKPGKVSVLSRGLLKDT